MELLDAYDEDPGKTSYLLASQRSSMMTMGGHQQYQSTVETCTTPEKVSAGRIWKTNEVTRLYCVIIDGIDTVKAKPNTNKNDDCAFAPS